MKFIPTFEYPSSLGLLPDSRAIAITLFGGGDLWAKSFRSVLQNTPHEVPIVIFEDAFKNDLAIEIAHEVYAEMAFDRPVFLNRNKKNLGVVANLNLAFKLLSPADVVVLNSDVIVGANWLLGLEGALKDPTIATVTALSTNSAIFSVREAANVLGSDPTVAEVEDVANRIWSRVIPVYPEVPTTVSCCALFRRSAIEIAGDLDEYFSPGYGEETDFSLRCMQFGFRHVAADNVLVYHEGGASFGNSKQVSTRKSQNDKEVERRFPFFRKMVTDLENDRQHPLNIAIRLCDSIIRGLEIVFDGTLINDNHTGTYVGAVGLLHGLAEHAWVRQVSVVCPPDRVRAMRTMFQKMNLSVYVISYSQLREGDFDLGFVPHQVYNPQVFDWMKDHTYRRIIWHLDFISTTIPRYFHNSDSFFFTKNVVRRSFKESDGILFLTTDAIDLARSKGLEVDSNRTFVVPCAPDINIKPVGIDSKEFAKMPDEYILVLGLGFLHKNRAFIEMIFSGICSDFPNTWLVFAGPYPTSGGDKLNLGQRVLELGKVNDSMRSQLIKSALLVISASVVEGFGLAPLEAAVLDTVSVVSKTLGHRSHGEAPFWIDLCSLSNSTTTVSHLLRDEVARAEQLNAWKMNVANYGWERSATDFVSAAFSVMAMTNRQFTIDNSTAIQLNWKGRVVDFIRRSGLVPEGTYRKKIALKILRVVQR